MTPRILTITGIRSSGKSTIARQLVEELRARGAKAELLDEVVYDPMLRMAALLVKNGVWVILVNSSASRETRENIRSYAILHGAPVFEVALTCSLQTAQRRGEWDEAYLYQPPLSPDFSVNTELTPAGACVDEILEHLLLSPQNDAPILFVGCGGSGTQLLSQMAQALGVFVGSDINDSDDSIEMADMIYWLVQETAKEPAPPGKFVSVIRDTVGKMLRRGKVTPDAPWGWKLSETLYVLPLILEAFPKARVVHLVRHPASVILDRPPHLSANMALPIGQCMLPLAYSEYGRDPLYIATDPPWIQGAISWLHQVQKTVTWCREKLPPSQYLEIKFEDLTARGPGVTCDLAGFLGLRPIRWRPAVDASRLNLPKADHPDLHKLWGICGMFAETLGYSI